LVLKFWDPKDNGISLEVMGQEIKPYFVSYFMQSVTFIAEIKKFNTTLLAQLYTPKSTKVK